MSQAFAVPWTDTASIAPELLLTASGIALLLLDVFLPSLRRALLPLALASLVGAGALAWSGMSMASSSSFGGFLECTPVTVLLGEIVLLAAVLCVLASQGYLRREAMLGGEYPALLLWCVVGLLLLIRAKELLTIFVALELLSLCLYALAAYHRRLPTAAESALKYFLMGAFVSTFVVLGIALLYGETGHTQLEEISRRLASGDFSTVPVTLGFLLLVAGFGFKMSVAPFHAWAPDTYQGAPSPFVAFLSVAPKAAAAFVVIRLLQTASPGLDMQQWSQLVALLAVLSMVVGNLLALVQKDLKRMLAYSGVAHMGYLLIPLVDLGEQSLDAVLVYLLAYALMNGAAFAAVALLFARPGEQHLISELAGWGYRFPLVGVCLTICMLSLGGVPPTLGFVGKYVVFVRAIQHDQLALALVGIAASLVGIFYYLRVVYVLYMKPEVAAPKGLLIDGWGRLAVLIGAVSSLVLGMWPGAVLAWVQQAIQRL
jgi:NADH-quinone oxidoreductase subunit N